MSNMTDLWLSGAIFSTSKYSKTRFRPGLRPGLRWGSLRRSPRPLSRLGRGTPLPIPLPPRRLRRLDLGAFGASVVRPPTQIPGYAYGQWGSSVSPPTVERDRRLWSFWTQ